MSKLFACILFMLACAVPGAMAAQAPGSSRETTILLAD